MRPAGWWPSEIFCSVLPSLDGTPRPNAWAWPGTASGQERERAEKTRAGAYVRMAETQQMDSGAYTSESSGWPAIACACVPLSGLVDLVCCGCSRSISTTRFFLGGGCRPIATFPFPFAVAFDLILFSAACHAYRARFIFIRLTASGQEI
jgi:hypothetical protein